MLEIKEQCNLVWKIDLELILSLFLCNKLLKMQHHHFNFLKSHICNEKNHPDAPRKEKFRMRILKFASKISLNLAELINSGIVSYLNKKHAMIEEIIHLKKHIMNSGIRVAA